MNINSVLSLPWAVPANAADMVRVKMIAGGVELAGATDSFIGTSLQGDLNVEQASVHVRTFGIHYATVGNATALAPGDAIEGFANGRVVKRTAGTIIGVVADLSPNDGAAAAGDVVRVIYY